MRRTNIGNPPRPGANAFEQWLVQALFEIQKASHDESLSDLATLKRSAGHLIVADGVKWIATTAATVLAALPDGTEDAPALAFETDPDSGFYMFSTGVIGVSVGGSLIGAWTTGGYDGPLGQGTPNVGAFTNLSFSGTLTGFSDTAHGSRGGGDLHTEATTDTAGFMSAADKTKLDGL